MFSSERCTLHVVYSKDIVQQESMTDLNENTEHEMRK